VVDGVSLNISLRCCCGCTATMELSKGGDDIYLKGRVMGTRNKGKRKKSRTSNKKRSDDAETPSSMSTQRRERNEKSVVIKPAPTRVSALQRIITTIQQRVAENKEALGYVALFLGLCLVFYLVYYHLTVSDSLVMTHVRENTALLLGGIFSLGGAEVVVRGAFVMVDGFGLEIIDECTAVFSSIVFCSSVGAYPTTLKKKALGILLGVPVLYAINLFRLIILTLVGISAPNFFEFVHVYLWQASFIIFVVMIFLLWLRFVVNE
jgi:archaeosortase B (VPXXXP-CTERM-specific)